MSDAINAVRAHVGRRHRITRAEMIHILTTTPMDLPNASTITSRDRDGRLWVSNEPVRLPSEEPRAVATAWAGLCKHITCVSVLPTSYYVGDELREGLGVRFDEPGSMHPLQMAEVMFAPSTMDTSSLNYLRRHAKRLLLVLP